MIGETGMEDERLYGNSVLPIQFFCKSKTAPKNSLLIFKKPKWKNLSSTNFFSLCWSPIFPSFVRGTMSQVFTKKFVSLISHKRHSKYQYTDPFCLILSGILPAMSARKALVLEFPFHKMQTDLLGIQLLQMKLSLGEDC